MNNKNFREVPLHLLREQLRQQSAAQAEILSRSVNRLTSCDAQPCPEYREEVMAEYAVIDRLLYFQQCRASLERCLAGGFARLRYRWKDGRVSEVTFRRTAPGRIKVRGLEGAAAPLKKAS